MPLWVCALQPLHRLRLFPDRGHRHLLGKKSWNVYNADNIARVQRDEAAAKAAEEAEEQRMQESDAQRRLAILRGKAPLPVLEEAREAKASRATPFAAIPRNDHDGGTRRKRKRADEDDTDFEVRLVRERSDLMTRASRELHIPSSAAPIIDTAGHIDLIGLDEGRGVQMDKRKQVEKASGQAQRTGFEDKFNMRFSNAAGKGASARPWYAYVDMEATATAEAASKYVWGNEDPRRKKREAQRLAADDPLALMKKGASRVREMNRGRQRAQQERDEELRELYEDDGDQRRERRRRHRSRSPSSTGRSNRHRRRQSRDRHEGIEERQNAGERRRRDDGRSRMLQ